MQTHIAGMGDVAKWLVARGCPVGQMPRQGVAVKTVRDWQPGEGGFWAVAEEQGALALVCPEWRREVERVVETLNVTELFSVFGAYEMTRVTLPRGFGVWGPTWYFSGNEESFSPCPIASVRRLNDAEQEAVDTRVFWHAVPSAGSVGFGSFDGDRLIALAVAYPRHRTLWEIGLDVHPEAKGAGLGSQVFSAAARFALDQGGAIVARSAPWNVPSVRLLRRLGLRLACRDLRLLPEPVRVPPQPLGHPVAAARLQQYYPEWSMNQNIQARP